MKVWRASYRDEWEGTCVLWAGSQRELRALIREATGTSRPGELLIHPVEIGTTRADLIRWLRGNVTRANG